MPTFKIPSLLRDRMITFGILTTGSNYYNPSWLHTSNRFRIMKGVMPTQSEIEFITPSWSRISGSPGSDVLIEYSVTYAYQQEEAFANNGNVYLARQYHHAIQSGTATWWCWTGFTGFTPSDFHGSPYDPNGGKEFLPILPCIAGSISERGGSPVGDLIMRDIDIVAGEYYQIGPFEIGVPEVYTY